MHHLQSGRITLHVCWADGRKVNRSRQSKASRDSTLQSPTSGMIDWNPASLQYTQYPVCSSELRRLTETKELLYWIRSSTFLRENNARNNDGSGNLWGTYTDEVVQERINSHFSSKTCKIILYIKHCAKFLKKHETVQNGIFEHVNVHISHSSPSETHNSKTKSMGKKRKNKMHGGIELALGWNCVCVCVSIRLTTISNIQIDAHF